MKRIIGFANIGLLLSAILAVGAVTGFGQDNCADTAGQTTLSDKVRALFTDKTTGGMKNRIAAGKEFIEKYGACDSAKEFSTYLTSNVPKWEGTYAKMVAGDYQDALVKRFNAGINTGTTSGNWDEVYATGKELLQKYPEDFRAASLVLGSIGLDETAKATPVVKYNDDTIRFARQAIADLEANRTFKTFGVKPFEYKDKNDALGWMNYTIGYLYFYDKKDKKQGVNFMYKATQVESTTKSNPVLYQAIGAFYFDEVKRLATEVTALEKTQDPNATPEAAKALVDAIKAKVALVNGNAEAAIDAYARALTYAKADPAKYKKEYLDSLNTTMQNLYTVRFGKMDGFDAFVANLVKKPLPNPAIPIAPISDPDPTVTTTTSGTSMGVPSGNGIGNVSGNGMGTPTGAGIGGVKPAVTAAKPVAPAVKPIKP